MTVIVQSPVIASAPVGLSFADNFNRADTTAMWGDLWNIYYTNLNNGVFIQSNNIAGMWQINANHGRMKSLQTGGGGFALGLYMVPRKVNGLFGRSQFVQATYVNGTGTVAEPVRTGPAVMINPNNNSAQSSYEMIAEFEVNGFFLGRGTGLSRVNIGAVPIGTLNAGDVLRMEARMQSTGTQLTTFRNGSVVDDRFDNSGPIQTGVPGFCFDGATNISVNLRCDDWDDFSCGPL